MVSIVTPVFVLNVHAGYERIFVLFIWHYHQPWYYSIGEDYFILPWVRMHSVGNYLKMAYILSKYLDIKVAFTFSGSLVEQIVDYVENGKMDLREIISWRIVNGSAAKDDIFNMLRIPGGFFDINWGRVIERSPRYKELRNLVQKLYSECQVKAKTSEEYSNCVVDGFTQGDLQGQNVVDLAVMFNLLWIDPEVARDLYPEIYMLMEEAYREVRPNFTRRDLAKVLSVHRDIMSRLLTAYRDLVLRNQAEIIPVPYSHPIAPLLVDAGLTEDLEVHVMKGIELVRKYLGIESIGIWPAEQAVNEDTLHVFRKAGVLWTVTDSTLLAKAGLRVSVENLGVPWYISFAEGRIYVFFRDTELSNLISFQYSSWDPDQAVNDLISRILRYRDEAKGPRAIVIALDGENPWENYLEFGDIFLNKLYSRLTELQKQGFLETITPREFIEKFSSEAKELPAKQYQYLDLIDKDISNFPKNSYGDAYTELPMKTVTAKIPEGSWSSGELATWIGHRQENVAWMWMVKAREDIMKKLGVAGFVDLYARYREIALYLLKAQASDWWWWYGGDGGGSPATFDPLFKAYLRRAYELSGLEPPHYLYVVAYPDGSPIGTINSIPPSLADRVPSVDGLIEDLWRKLVDEGKALQFVVGYSIPKAYAIINTTTILFAFNVSMKDIEDLTIAIYFATPNIDMSPYSPRYNVYPRYSKVDLGIHLAKEVAIYLGKREVSVSLADGRGGWDYAKSLGKLAVAQQQTSYVVELAFEIDEIGLARNCLVFFVVVVYKNSILIEWSSRLGLAHQLFIPTQPVEVVGKIIIDLYDPEGDDDGLGGLKYPTNPVFVPGVFDLTRFTLIDVNEKIVFRFTFRELGGNPWGGPNGWSFQQIHVYIKTSRAEEGKRDSIGLNVVIEHGWHMAILIAPGWGTDPLPKGERAAIYYYDREEVVVQNGILKAYADPTTKSIVVEISKNNLYDIESIDQWTLVVAVTSHDGYGTNKIRPFVVGGGEWAVGVPQQYALAMLRNVIPYILDILTPTKEDQYSMLNTFDADKGELAKIRGIFITTGAVLSTTSLMITPTMSSTSTITVSTIPSPTSPSTSSSLPSQSPSPTPSPWQEMPLEAILGVSIVIITMIVAILFVIIIRRTR